MWQLLISVQFSRHDTYNSVKKTLYLIRGNWQEGYLIHVDITNQALT